MKIMKDYNWTKQLLLLVSLFSWNSGQLWAQEDVLKLVRVPDKHGEMSFVVHDEASETIDLHLTARKGSRAYWDFYEGNLLAFETIKNGEKKPLEIIYQGRITNEAINGGEPIYQIKTRPKKEYHDDERTYTIVWKNTTTTTLEEEITQNWSTFEAFSLRKGYSFADTLSVGLFFLGLLLFILSELVPRIRKMQFMQKYVKPYLKVQKPDETKLHPITGKPLTPDEKVVAMCNKEICCQPYFLWERKGFQCPNYPQKCEGNAQLGFRQFFLQLGGFRRLNWLWFGALGGLLAWLLDAALSNISLTTMMRNEQWQVVFMGAALGMGLTAMLAWVEELGEGREVSWGRIFLKLAMGTVAAALLFVFAAIFEVYKSTVGTAVIWLVFCVVLGAILSFNSTITWQRGLLSGLIAGVISALVYFLISNVFPNPEAQMVRMITFLFAGGILGLGIIQVLKTLNQIELEVLTPSHRSGSTFSIDRWLKAGEAIIIGRDMKQSKVRVKWNDEYVLPHHAELSMTQGKVYIKPLGTAELYINDTPLLDGKSKELQGGERIQLGRHSQTSFKYLQKGN